MQAFQSLSSLWSDVVGARQLRTKVLRRHAPLAIPNPVARGGFGVQAPPIAACRNPMHMPVLQTCEYIQPIYHVTVRSCIMCWFTHASAPRCAGYLPPLRHHQRQFRQPRGQQLWERKSAHVRSSICNTQCTKNSAENVLSTKKIPENTRKTPEVEADGRYVFSMIPASPNFNGTCVC